MNQFTVPGARAIMAGTENLDINPLQSALENDSQSEYNASLESVRQLNAIYDQAAERIRQQRVGPTGGEYWYNLAAALAKPTKTGSRGETMANVAQALGQYKASQREAEAAKQQAIDQLMFNKQAEALKRRYAIEDATVKARMQYGRPVVVQSGAIAIDPTTRKVIARGQPKPDYVIRRFADGSYGYVPVSPGMNDLQLGPDTEEDPETLPADFFNEE